MKNCPDLGENWSLKRGTHSSLHRASYLSMHQWNILLEFSEYSSYHHVSYSDTLEHPEHASECIPVSFFTVLAFSQCQSLEDGKLIAECCDR